MTSPAVPRPPRRYCFSSRITRFPSLAAASAAETCVEIDSVSRPDPATHELYEKLFLKYKAVHDALAPIYRG